MSVEEIKRDCPDSVITLLEDLLTEAKSGKVTELVVLVSNGRHFYVEYTNSKDIAKLVGELELIKHSQITRMIKLD